MDDVKRFKPTINVVNARAEDTQKIIIPASPTKITAKTIDSFLDFDPIHIITMENEDLSNAFGRFVSHCLDVESRVRFSKNKLESYKKELEKEGKFILMTDMALNILEFMDQVISKMEHTTISGEEDTKSDISTRKIEDRKKIKSLFEELKSQHARLATNLFDVMNVLLPNVTNNNNSQQQQHIQEISNKYYRLTHSHEKDTLQRISNKTWNIHSNINSIKYELENCQLSVRRWKNEVSNVVISNSKNPSSFNLIAWKHILVYSINDNRKVHNTIKDMDYIYKWLYKYISSLRIPETGIPHGVVIVGDLMGAQQQHSILLEPMQPSYVPPVLFCESPSKEIDRIFEAVMSEPLPRIDYTNPITEETMLNMLNSIEMNTTTTNSK
jgi:hypothetical protein